MDLLKFQLRNRLETLDSDPGIRYHLIRCPGRMPDGQASFPALITEGLVKRDVVLEIWGEVFADSPGRRKVFINYALFPLGSTPNSFFLRQYDPKIGASPDELVGWLAKLNELGAYALVARAVRMLSYNGSRSFDQANTDLSTALVSLQSAFGVIPTASERELLRYISNRRCEVMRDAHTDPAYNGPLRLIPETVLKGGCP